MAHFFVKLSAPRPLFARATNAAGRAAMSGRRAFAGHDPVSRRGPGSRSEIHPMRAVARRTVH
jgi:hypothetical protein